MAPNSIMAWLYSPARGLSNNSLAKALNSLAAAGVLIGVCTPKRRDNTRYTLPSTTAQGSL